METAESIHQVTTLLESMQDPVDGYLGKTCILIPREKTVMRNLVYQPARVTTDSRTYTVKLLAKASPETKARITEQLLSELEVLKMDGPGAKMVCGGVQYRFFMEESEPHPPTYSFSSYSDGE